MYIVKKLLFYSNYAVPRHIKLDMMKIGFYHLVFILKGKMTYIADGVVYELNENDALLLPPGTIRERPQRDEPTKYVIFNFLPYDHKSLDLDIHIKSAVNPNIKKLLSLYPYTYILNFSQSINHEMKKTQHLMQNILNCILIELLDSQRYDTKNSHVLNAIKYINDHITSPLSLNEISEAIHISKEYTAKIFKEEMGKTVTEYINEQKMIIAKDMLSRNEMSLRDTALNLGYENYSYFSRVFKKHFNASPTKIKDSLK